MNRWLLTAFAVLFSAALCSADQGGRLKANDVNVWIPGTSISAPGDAGYMMHTNHMIYFGPNNAVEQLGPQYSMVFGPSLFAANPSGYSPTQIKSAYGLPSTGGSGTICIVDAYNYPTALNDFNVFSGQYGLPKETSTNVTASTNQHFQVVYGSGSKPAGNGGWNEEEALDIEWAHAMAPNAKIVLVEASSASDAGLLQAESVAASQSGCREVSNSWGGGEFSGEHSDDSYFSHAGVVFFASAGDTGGAQEWPAESPNVVGCGGTTLNLNSSGGRSSETAWADSGGGPSSYESIPSYQSVISSIVGTHRGCPDIASDSNPSTGVAVYDSTNYEGYVGWLVFGGTSVASPTLAGVANLADRNEGSSLNELNLVYGGYKGAKYFDITSGSAGRFKAVVGWDYITGVGSLIGDGGL
ncbi:MAG TPA: S53 family peptidase [Fimbriimonadaceae bacterium]|jgi:subtilase family serine protease